MVRDICFCTVTALGVDSMEIEILNERGDLVVPLTLVYALLRRGLAKLSGRKMIILDPQAAASIKLDPDDIVPEIGFCPAGEPEIIDIEDEVLNEVCMELYKYFEDRCAACAIKVYSTVGETWLVDEKTLIEILRVAKELYLPIEWSRGNIVYTTCPEDYNRAREELKPGDYVKGIEKLREAARLIVARTRIGGTGLG